MGLIPYPVVPVYLMTPRGKERFEFIVDTGADITTLPHNLIKLLGLRAERLKPSEAQGIGKSVTKTWEGRIEMTFCELTFSCRCSFTDNNSTPLLMGKTDIFGRFDFYFDNKNDRLVVKTI